MALAGDAARSRDETAAMALSSTARRLIFLVALLTLRALLDYGYRTVVAVDYAYANYTLAENSELLPVSYLAVLFWGLVAPINALTVSSRLFTGLLLLVLLPLSSFYALRGDDQSFFLACNAFFLIVLAVIRIVPAVPIGTFRNGGARRFVNLTLLTTAVVVIWAASRGGLALATFNISEIYDVRAIVQEQVFAGLLGYLASWLGKVLIPALFVVGLWKNWRWLVALAVALSVLMFGLTTAKEMLVYPIIAAVAYLGDRGRYFQIYFLLGLLTVAAGAMIVSLQSDEPTLAAAVVFQRAFYAPAKISYDYFYFFSEHPHTYWSNAFLGWLIENPYDEPIPLILGEGQWGESTQVFANTGVLGSAYMHFGWFGIMVLFPVMTGLMFRVVDWLVENRVPRNVGLAISLPAALQLANGDLSATLLSHGFVVSCIALFLIGERRHRNAAGTIA